MSIMSCIAFFRFVIAGQEIEFVDKFFFDGFGDEVGQSLRLGCQIHIPVSERRVSFDGHLARFIKPVKQPGISGRPGFRNNFFGNLPGR